MPTNGQTIPSTKDIADPFRAAHAAAYAALRALLGAFDAIETAAASERCACRREALAVVRRQASVVACEAAMLAELAEVRCRLRALFA